MLNININTNLQNIIFIQAAFNQVKKHRLFLFIVLLALFLRSFHLYTLTTFGRDQGIDFLAIKQLLDTKDIPLTGIQVSFAEFHQGPVYLYILTPFFILFKMQPISGAIAAITISLLTLVVLYIFLLKFANIQSAIIGSLIFAISPQFIKYGNTPLYQHFVPLPIIISLYLFLTSINLTNSKKYYQKYFLYIIASGFFAGVAMEMHFLSITFSISLLIFLLLQNSRRFNNITVYLFGIFLGLIPTILFELKNYFINTRAFLDYLQMPSESILTFGNKITTWINGVSYFFGGDNFIIGLIVLVFCLVIIVGKFLTKNKIYSSIRKITLIELIVCLVYSSAAKNLGWWYMLPLWIMFLICISIFLSSKFKSFRISLIAVTITIVNLIQSTLQLNSDHGYYMPSGLSLKSETQAAQLILNDAHGWNENFNIVDIASGDTRAYALRYILEILGKTPGNITEYNQNNALYIIYSTPKEEIENILKEPVWEISQFTPYKLGRNWQLNNSIYIQRLDRVIKN